MRTDEVSSGVVCSTLALTLCLCLQDTEGAGGQSQGEDCPAGPQPRTEDTGLLLTFPFVCCE